MLVLDHLPIRLRTLLTFAFGIQIPHSLMQWNPLSTANNKHLELYQSTNTAYTHTPSTWSDDRIAPSTSEQLFSWQAALGMKYFVCQDSSAQHEGKITQVFLSFLGGLFFPLLPQRFHGPWDRRDRGKVILTCALVKLGRGGREDSQAEPACGA